VSQSLLTSSHFFFPLSDAPSHQSTTVSSPNTMAHRQYLKWKGKWKFKFVCSNVRACLLVSLQGEKESFIAYEKKSFIQMTLN
jgi:hypothetical protein